MKRNEYFDIEKIYSSVNDNFPTICFFFYRQIGNNNGTVHPNWIFSLMPTLLNIRSHVTLHRLTLFSWTILAIVALHLAIIIYNVTHRIVINIGIPSRIHSHTNIPSSIMISVSAVLYIALLSRFVFFILFLPQKDIVVLRSNKQTSSLPEPFTSHQ